MLSHKYSIVHEIFVILFVVKKSLKQSILANVKFSLIMNQSILIFPTTQFQDLFKPEKNSIPAISTANRLLLKLANNLNKTKLLQKPDTVIIRIPD